MKIWLDGGLSWKKRRQARIPVTDHGFLYGDGIFEGHAGLSPQDSSVSRIT